MPEIQIVDANAGIPEDKLRGLISQGWMVLPKVTIGPGTAIAVAGSQPTCVVDVWVSPPEPMIPQSFIAGLVITLKVKGEGDWVTLDKIARAVFGIGLKELETRVQFAPPDGDQPTPERPDSEMGGDPGDAQSNILKFPGSNGDASP